MITDDDFAKAFDRVAHTPDGELIYLYFQKILMGVSRAPDAGALHFNEGRRSLAQDITNLMGKGIDASGGRTDDTSNPGQRTERPVVLSGRGPVSTGGVRQSPREWLRDNDPELKRDPAAGSGG